MRANAQECRRFRCPELRVARFEIGDLVLTGRLEDAVAGVPIRLHLNVVEMSVRQSAERWLGVVCEMQ